MKRRSDEVRAQTVVERVHDGSRARAWWEVLNRLRLLTRVETELTAAIANTLRSRHEVS
jgi:hypothetical protein